MRLLASMYGCNACCNVLARLVVQALPVGPLPQFFRDRWWICSVRSREVSRLICTSSPLMTSDTSRLDGKAREGGGNSSTPVLKNSVAVTGHHTYFPRNIMYGCTELISGDAFVQQLEALGSGSTVAHGVTDAGDSADATVS